MIVGVVLAAGASKRMGQPKALLQFRGKTFLENIVTTLRAAAMDRIIIAISPDDDKIKGLIDLTAVDIVYNEDTVATGPINSVKAALALFINHPVESALIWPVDLPHVRLETVRSLLKVFDRHRPDIVVPVFNGRRGHPVLFARPVFGELLSAPQDQGARSVVRRVPSRVFELPVADRAVLDDIDTPEDYQRLISSTESLL